MAPLDISLCHLDIVSQTARHTPAVRRKVPKGFSCFCFTYCEPQKRTLSEATSARRGRAYKSREDKKCTAIKLRLGKANLVRFLTKLQAKYWDEFDGNYDLILNFYKILFTRNLLYN